jgi:hypothetical protein
LSTWRARSAGGGDRGGCRPGFLASGLGDNAGYTPTSADAKLVLAKLLAAAKSAV